MTQKSLTIVMSGVDRISGVARGVGRSIVGIGDAVVSMGRIATAPLRGLLRSITSLQTLVVGTVAALGAARVIGSVNRLAEELDRLGLSAQRTAASVQTLSLFRFLGQRIGQNVQDVGDLVGDLIERVAEAVRFGQGQGVETMRRLGIEATDLHGRLKPTDELLFETLEKINAVAEPSVREFFTKELFGDQAARFLPFFNLGVEKLQQIREEADRLGVIFTPEQVAAATLYREGLARVQAAMDGLRASLIGRFGEDLGRLLTALATRIAAVPDVLGRLIEIVRGFISGELAQETRAQLNRLGSTIGYTVALLIENIARVAGTAAVIALTQMLDVVMGILGDQTLTKIDVWVTRTGAGVVAAAEHFGNLFQDAFFGAGHFGLDADKLDFAGVMRRAADEAESALRDQAASVSNSEAMLQLLGINLGDSGLSALLYDQIQRLKDDLGAGAGHIGQQLDGMLGVAEAIARSEVNASKFADTLARLTGGRGAGVSAIAAEAQNLFAFGERLVQSVAQGLSTQLAGGFVDAIQGVRSFGEAMRDVFSQVLRMIAEAVLRMAVLRAISAGLGLFGGGGGGGGGALPAVAAALSPTLANRGAAGVMRSGSMPFDALGIRPVRAERGMAGLAGLVPGPAIPRDIVPAVLTPGESVLTAGATRRIGVGAIAQANAGGTLAPGGGGGGGPVYQITVAPTVVVRGAMDDKARGDIGREIAAAVVQQIEQSPQLRGRVKSVVRG